MGVSRVVAVAAVVRATVAGAIGVAVVSCVALHAFDSHYGFPVPELQTDATPASSALGVAIQVQEAAGLRCGSDPVLTDTVLVQRDGERIVVLPFAEALVAAARDEGSVRSYCR